MKKLIFAIILSMSVCISAFADDLTVQQLVHMCNGEDPDMKQHEVFCSE